MAAKLGRLSQSINDFRERQLNSSNQLADTLEVIDRRLTYLKHRAWTTHPTSPGPVGPAPPEPPPSTPPVTPAVLPIPAGTPLGAVAPEGVSPR